MSRIHPAPENHVVVCQPRELRSAPRTIVRFGNAPDGLPWLIDVDRSDRLDRLFRTVLGVFELLDVADLPEQVRVAVERDVASGLMGVHDVDTRSDGINRSVYVSRHKSKRLLGPTLLSQMLEVSSSVREEESELSAATNVGALAAREADLEMVEAVERSIDDRKAKRHLLIELDSGHALTGSVRKQHRALRQPAPPFRPLALESLTVLGDVKAHVVSTGVSWTVPLADWEQYADALTRAAQTPSGGSVTYKVSRAALLRVLVDVARDVASLHARELVHADLAPGNVLIAEQGPVSFDSLDVAAGSPATAATFEWAAPEQIVGRPIDPRTDVFALGKLATAIIGGVPFGEETNYVLPIGSGRSRRVQLLKCEGVFIDILETEHERSWQLAWQELLGATMAHDVNKRPTTAGAFADQLAEVLDGHPPVGDIDCPGVFGNLTAMDLGDSWTFARVVDD